MRELDHKEGWSEVAQLCLTLCDPVDCVHGIFQARVLEWVAISFSRGICIVGRFFTIWTTREVSKKAEYWRIDAFELWSWRRLLRDPWTARRSNQSILKGINPEYSLEGLMLKWGFPCSSVGKESACNAGDLGSIPESGRSRGEGNGNPLQYSCLGNPRDRGACRATVHGIAESDTTERLNTQAKNTIL